MQKSIAVQLLKDVFELNEGKLVNVTAGRLRSIGYEPPGTSDLDENGQPVEIPVPDERFVALTVLKARQLCHSWIERCNAAEQAARDAADAAAAAEGANEAAADPSLESLENE